MIKTVLVVTAIAMAFCQGQADSDTDLAELVHQLLKSKQIQNILNEQPSTAEKVLKGKLMKERLEDQSPPAEQVLKGKLIQEILNEQPPQISSRVMKVETALDEVWGTVGYATQLFCSYSVSTGEDLPVTVTWKVGDGPRNARTILVCNGYTDATKSCTTSTVEDPWFSGRVRIAENSPSMEITNVMANDNRNYWCQVAVEKPLNIELEFDMKSVVLRVYNENYQGKAHTVKVDDNLQGTVGQRVSIGCECESGGHCDDVYWYKGPTDASGSNYNLAYSRTSYFRPLPTQHKSHNQWVNRTQLEGNSLVILDLKLEDSGRYWCELRAATFYQIGELSTDAESVVLEVQKNNTAEPFDCLNLVDGIYQDPQSCQHYYECSNSVSSRQMCADGTIYNPDNTLEPHTVCDYAENVPPPCGTKE